MTDKIDDGGAAFALHIPGGERPVMGGRIEYIAEKYYPGMSLRQYAAIHLRVPASGLPWLDAMIAERRREGK